MPSIVLCILSSLLMLPPRRTLSHRSRTSSPASKLASKTLRPWRRRSRTFRSVKQGKEYCKPLIRFSSLPLPLPPLLADDEEISFNDVLVCEIPELQAIYRHFRLR